MSGHRITQVWLFVVLDPADNNEGVPALGPMLIGGEPMMVPMICSDETRRDILNAGAHAMAREYGMTVELRRFDGPYVVEAVIAPPAAGHG